jgi:Tfp pilus assembly protein PilO
MELPTTPGSLDSRFRRYYHDLAPVLKKPKMRATTAAVFSFLAASLFLWYAVRPTAQTIIYLQREIADKTTLNQQMEAKITALIEAQSTYENIKDRLPVLSQALPQNSDAVILARELRNIANTANATVSAMQIPSVPLITKESTPGSNLIATTPLQDYALTMVVSGPYDAIKQYLNGLLVLRRITSIDNLTIRQGTEIVASGSANTLQLSIRLKSYYSQQ